MKYLRQCLQMSRSPAPGAPNTCTHTQEPHLVHDAYIMTSRKKTVFVASRCKCRTSSGNDSLCNNALLRHLVEICLELMTHFVEGSGKAFAEKKSSASQPQMILKENYCGRLLPKMIDSHYQSHLRLHCRLQGVYKRFRY